ncbi:hypothetical protein EDD21DRAFT_364064 [Dissophora ornata]|nr:hypothetical protein BGZ58_002453 [Dissophora ornata]KAI8605267.1 hypothetical protein EDD21DRAFT_364064 [Dissophora ornata]
MSKHEIKLTSLKETSRAMMTLLEGSYTIDDPSGEAWKGFPGYLEGFGKPEVGLSLEQFSMQATSISDWTDDEIDTHFGLATYPDARKMITLFGASMFGKVVEYGGISGYYPIHILDIEQSYCGPDDSNEPFSEIFKAHNMGVYGSGGLMELRNDLYERLNSAVSIDGNVRQYAKRDDTQRSFTKFQGFKERHVDFEKLSWCRTARAIQTCWRVSCTLDEDWGGWLLKVAVHAACTLERARRGELDTATATIILFQLSREIGYGIQYTVSFHASKEVASVAAMLLEAGLGLISAGLCQIFSGPQQEEEYSLLLFGLSVDCGNCLFSAAHTTSSFVEWNQLALECIKTTNFCISRQKATTELHSERTFHLIARSQHLTTSQRLHSSCGDTCVKAFSTANHQQAGHLDEGCQCPVRYFEPKETADLILFDTENQELVVAEPRDRYVAVSQVWFQGIFGQSSRKCGECSLRHLRMACSSLGVRYAWIDTLCMPASMDLRRKVIEQLRSIYLNAAATLVMDIGLLSTTARSVLDLSLAIWLSDWASRVWTLQEGVLASKLLFCVGEHVFAIPQPRGPDLLIDTRNRIPSTALEGYGLGKDGLGQRFEVVLRLAANRQTTHQADYLYGLSALLPSVPENRSQGLEQVAVEVAQMYGSVDLGILQVPLDRCRTEGFRWMPLAAEMMSRVIETNVKGLIFGIGLVCPITAFIKLDTYTDGLIKGFNKRDAELSVLMDMNVKYWYSTEEPGAFVGTSTKADNMIFCLLGHADEIRSFGFVVSPDGPENSVKFQYVGEAVVYGTVQANPKQIIVT